MSISSIYSSIEDVPLVLTPQFMSLKPIKLPADFNLDIPQLGHYDFNLERSVISETERYREEIIKLAQIRSQKLQAFQEARLQKQKEEARKIAPGFLDTDRRMLTPVLVNNTKRRSSHIENGNGIIFASEENNDKNQKNHLRSASDDLSNRVVVCLKSKSGDDDDGDETNFKKPFDYLEFEEQLSKNNQKTPIQDDISILKEVIRNSISVSSPPLSKSPSSSNHGIALGQQIGGGGIAEQLATNLAYMQISKNNYSNQSLSPVNNSNSYINSSGGLGQMSLSAPSSFHERKVLNQTSIMPPIRPPKEVIKLSSPTDVAHLFS
ncbi:14492_t:CDS:2 [Entrophospora sp. SA101]|nr:14492_t:CDS:2 [Entrophospora sp. SA101]